jgi:predicted transcriptional regulator
LKGAQVMKNTSKEFLQKHYLQQKLTPYKIAELLGVNHKTVRSYLKKYRIPMRTASEHNFLARKSHTSPDNKKLQSKLSVAGHSAFLCEGWHTEKTNAFYFCNTDPALVLLVFNMLIKIYQVKRIAVQIMAKEKTSTEKLFDIFPEASFVKEKDRKNPIVRLRCGGKPC